MTPGLAARTAAPARARARDDEMDNEKRVRDIITSYSRYVARNTAGDGFSPSIFAEANLREVHRDAEACQIFERGTEYPWVTVPALHICSPIFDSIGDYSDLYESAYLRNGGWTVELSYPEMYYTLIRLEHVYYEQPAVSSGWRDVNMLESAKRMFTDNWNSCVHRHPTEDECAALLRSLRAAKNRAWLLKTLLKAAAALAGCYLVITMATSLFSGPREGPSRRREVAPARDMAGDDLDYVSGYGEERYEGASAPTENHDDLSELEELARELEERPVNPDWPTTDSELLAVPDDNRWYFSCNHIGETHTVVGPVVRVYQALDEAGQPIFIDVGNEYPAPKRFTVVIWAQDLDYGFREMVEDVDDGNAWLSITGRISSYDGVPQMSSGDGPMEFEWYTNVR